MDELGLPADLPLAEAFGQMPSGVAYCQMLYRDGQPADFAFLYVNPAFERQTGLAAVAGKRASDAIPAVHDAEPELLAAFGRVAAGAQPERFEAYISSLRNWFSIQAFSPMRERFVAIFEVVTERRRVEDQLRESEARYARIIAATDEGIWEWDLAAGQIRVGAGFESMLGFARGELQPSPQTWWNQLHPADAGPARALFEEHLARRTPRYLAEFRMKTSSGDWKWIASRGMVARRGANGKASFVCGTHTDISARKQSEEALQNMSCDFVTLLELTSDFIYFKDRAARIRYCSQTMAEITGHGNWRELVGKHDREIFPAETARVYEDEERPILEQGVPLLDRTDPYIDRDGKPGWVSTNKWPIKSADGGEVVGLFGISRVITEHVLLESRLREMATTDFLTGVSTRRAFVARLEQEIARLNRNVEGATSLLMFDLDLFKGVNDNFGHATGDRVLRHVAALMKAEARSIDLVARLGGEEFAILLPAAWCGSDGGADLRGAAAAEDRGKPRRGRGQVIDDDRQRRHHGAATPGLVGIRAAYPRRQRPVSRQTRRTQPGQLQRVAAVPRRLARRIGSDLTGPAVRSSAVRDERPLRRRGGAGRPRR